MPSTDSTPRMADSCAGTGISTSRCGRIAEVLVDLLFDLGQRGAQLLHHAAHGLAVGDAPVQLLHPEFQRLRLAPPRTSSMRCARSLHAQGSSGWSSSPSSSVASRYSMPVATSIASAGAGACPLCTVWATVACSACASTSPSGTASAANRRPAANCSASAAHAVQFATGDGRPGVLGHRHALLGQRQPGRVKTAQPRRLVVFA
jgi:hypothetical protein